MGRFVKGEVVVLPFPFSDLSGSKLRPALVLADLSGDDIILCQITSQMSPKDSHAIALDIKDFQKGALKVPSNIRPNRIFTADKNIIQKSVGIVNSAMFEKVIDAIVALLKY
jgi:mRNA interferase MazF